MVRRAWASLSDTWMCAMVGRVWEGEEGRGGVARRAWVSLSDTRVCAMVRRIKDGEDGKGWQGGLGVLLFQIPGCVQW